MPLRSTWIRGILVEAKHRFSFPDLTAALLNYVHDPEVHVDNCSAIILLSVRHGDVSCRAHIHPRIFWAGQSTDAFRVCQKRNDCNDLSTALKNLQKRYLHPKDWTWLTVVRDPLDRFVFAFVDKCVG